MSSGNTRPEQQSAALPNCVTGIGQATPVTKQDGAIDVISSLPQL
jgi:hypothetical protein